MLQSRRLIELALVGLKVERNRLGTEIAELTAQLGTAGRGETEKPKRRVRPARRSKGTIQTEVLPRRGKGGLTAAGRKRLSEAAKRRWAASKKSGKPTL